MALVENGLKYDSYYKFITSLGVVIVLVPFVFAAFMFAQMEAMTELAKEYAKLTYPTKNLLDLWISLPIYMGAHPVRCLIAFGVCELIGCSSVFVGLRGWKRVQEFQDTTEEKGAELKTLEVEEKKGSLKTSKATPDEVVAETTREYSPAFLPAGDNGGGDSSVDPEERGHSDVESQTVEPTPEWQFNDRLKDSLEIEHRCINRLAYLLAEDYVVESNVWIGRANTKKGVYFDAIARPRDSKPYTFAEVHYVWKDAPKGWARELAAKISLCQDTLKKRVDGEVRAIVVIVLDDDVSSEGVLEGVSDALKTKVDARSRFGFCVFCVSRSDVDTFELAE